MAKVQAKVVEKIDAVAATAQEEGRVINAAAFSELADETTTAITNVNAAIKADVDQLIEDGASLTSDEVKTAFSTSQVLEKQIKTAVKGEVEVPNSGSASITFADVNVVAAAIKNIAPVSLTLSNSSIAENSTSFLVGTLSAEDDDDLGVSPFSIVEAAGTDHNLFEIKNDNELHLKSAANFETDPSYKVLIDVTDAGGKSLRKSFSIDVQDLNDPLTGDVIISGTKAQGEVLTADISNLVEEDGFGELSFQWKADGTNIDGATSETLTLTQAEVGKTITVEVSYTDGQGTAESVTSAATDAVANVNDAPTGEMAITGTARQGEVLTATQGTLDDLDGIAEDAVISFQWKADGTNIDGATSETLTLTQAEVGKAITVTASYTDEGGTLETVTSPATAAVENVNDAPTGTVTITGTSTQGETLTAENTLAVIDGLGALSFQWKADGTNIDGATSETLTLTQAEVGKTITVEVSYTDGQGTAESVTSAATDAVANVNDAPTGEMAITGTARQGEVLTATQGTLDDLDGIAEDAVISFQWKADGTNIDGATSETLTLTQAEVGKAITVTASYTDEGGTLETVTSPATAAVENVNDALTGELSISGSATQGSIITADTSGLDDLDGFGELSFQWKADGTNIDGATSETFSLTQAEVGKTITVQVSYTDLGGTAESITSAASPIVKNANDPVTGNVLITGNAVQGQVLTADTSFLEDQDGLGAFSFQWKADGTNIDGATSESLTLTQAEVGKTITVEVSYTDGQGTAESVASLFATDAVANVNDAPTGEMAITGTARQGEVLTATQGTLDDPDGIAEDAVISFQWKADGTNIDGATSETLTLTQAEVGKAITVTASYTDEGGTLETVTSPATAAVENVNEAPTGTVTITGTSTQGETLTAENTLADIDGLGALSFQWKADGTNIDGATSETLTLTQAEVGKTITVEVSYTDGQGTAESVTSAATDAVANVNDAPTGEMAITGTARQGEVLTATQGTLDDLDGIAEDAVISFQWKADGTNIDGATSETLTLTQAEVGKAITVTASYTDEGGTLETVTSPATAAVANVNDDPTGEMAITGTARQCEVLTATQGTLVDPDGIAEDAVISFQWNRDGVAIDGATAETFTLAQEDVGSVITVTASYTDEGGTLETVTSPATAAVANVNDDPTGTVTITGTSTQGETLTAENTLADIDGLGALSFQWKADGTNIDGATSETLTLTQAEVGKTITVEVSYTDGQGTAESVTSAATDAVANVNDAPTGEMAITGTARQGEVLTATQGTLDDLDGIAEDAVISFQWKADGTNIDGATSETLTLTQAEVGKAITVTASYTDEGGTLETVTSPATAAVENVNDAPTGTVTITGTSTQGETLTAENTLADIDGLGALSFQWKADGTNIDGATSETLTLTQAEVGKTITVEVSYTDGQGTAESVTSAATDAVANVNDAPTGEMAITGTARQGEVLTATQGTLDDLDGIAEDAVISFQWKADGTNIDGATSETLTLTQAEVGKAITVTASYTDEGGTLETVTSPATAAVANVNDDPTGEMAITGTARQGEVLTATQGTLVDPDGIAEDAVISFQWNRDGVAIDGATAETFTLAQEDVGSVITVTASYTDEGGTLETVTSAATAAVENVNDAPTGTVTITGALIPGETLTAENTLADIDGLGALSFQWKADGTNIDGATSETFTLTHEEFADTITVEVSYTDGQGTAESVTSAATNQISIMTGSVRTLNATELFSEARLAASADDTYFALDINMDISGVEAVLDDIGTFLYSFDTTNSPFEAITGETFFAIKPADSFFTGLVTNDPSSLEFSSGFITDISGNPILSSDPNSLFPSSGKIATVYFNLDDSITEFNLDIVNAAVVETIEGGQENFLLPNLSVDVL